MLFETHCQLVTETFHYCLALLGYIFS